MQLFYYSFYLRLLARLSCETNPREALNHATTAVSLGDIAAPAIQSYILDHSTLGPSSIMGKDRLSTISQLIAKLDPVFAFNASSTQHTRETGLVNTLAGIDNP